LVSLTLLALALAATPDAEQQLGFARSLYGEGDYYRAIGEYKRFLYLYPDSPLSDEARLAIGRAYLHGEQPDASEAHFLSLAELSPEWRARALLEIGWSRYSSGRSQAAILALQSFLRESAGQATTDVDRAHYLLGWALLTEGDGKAAMQAFASVTSLNGKGPLTEAARNWSSLPRKSPVIAALLSVVPGAGHVYIGEPVVGLAALGWNGLFSFALYEAIRRDQVGIAVLLGALEMIWYTGTIFGAVSGAQKYNRDVRLQALDGLRARFHDRPESWPPNTVPH
jgi:tetratricopeptide (TPR) repeat protein